MNTLYDVQITSRIVYNDTLKSLLGAFKEDEERRQIEIEYNEDQHNDILESILQDVALMGDE